jgi:hypothetical protein
MSIMSLPPVTGHSAKVRLELRIGSECYSVAQIGSDRLWFDRDVRLPGNSGEVCVHIDEYEKRMLATWEASDAPRRVVWATFRRIA